MEKNVCNGIIRFIYLKNRERENIDNYSKKNKKKIMFFSYKVWCVMCSGKILILNILYID